MESKMFTVFGLFMLFCVIQQSTALKCYTCSSTTNKDCENRGSSLQQCSVDNVVAQTSNFLNQFGGSSANDANNAMNAVKHQLNPTCLKIVVSYGGVKGVDRRCSVKYQGADPCEALPTGGLMEFCGTCEQDGCNSGNSVQLFSSLIVFGALVCTARLFV